MTDERTIRKIQPALVRELELAGATVQGRTVKCPFHDDRSPSASIYQRDDGAWAFHCHTCSWDGDIFDVRARRTGQELGDVLPGCESPRERTTTAPKEPAAAFGSLEEIKEHFGDEHRETYLYSEPTARANDLVVVHLHKHKKKTFRQFHPVDGGYAWGASEKPWPIYDGGLSLETERVLFVEGEKCVEACRTIGVVATTTPCGAGKSEYADMSPLAGRRVVLWPDRDTAGVNHMQDVAGILEHLRPSPTVYWIDPETLDLPPKGDVADYIERFGNDAAAQIKTVMDNAVSMAGPSDEVVQVYEETISGKRRVVPWPWKLMGRLSRALMPQTLTLLCGEPGMGKSFMLLQAAAYWYAHGEQVAVYELEEDRAFHLSRGLAQELGTSDILEPKWVKNNPDWMRSQLKDKQSFLDGFGRCIFACPDSDISMDDLSDWVRDRARDGCRVIAVDPVTAASSEKPWRDDRKCIMDCKSIMRDSKSSLVLVTHPKKARRVKQPDLDDLAGGAAFQRFCQTIFWLDRPKHETCSVEKSAGTMEVELNRVVHFVKTRNGRGEGMRLGFNFSPETLRFIEEGLIKSEKKHVSTEDTPPF